MNLTKYEKETIILTSEGDSCYSVYTYNQALKRKLAELERQYPTCFKLKKSTAEGSVTYLVDKARLSLRFTAPWSKERRLAMRERARENGLIE